MKKDEKSLRYTVNDDEYVFFYGDEILFYNSKSNPFLYITLEKEGVKKELPLSYCDIFRNDNSEYRIKFYNNNCAVNVKIKVEKSKLSFEFIKLGFFGETLNINLYRKNSKIKGMGLNTYKDINNLSCDRNGFFEKKDFYDIKPSFSIKNGYFFKNINIEDYKLYFYGSSVKLTTKQNSGQFFLEFDKLYYFGDKKEDKLFYCSEKKMIQESERESKYNGFILPYRESEDFKDVVKKVRKNGYKVYLIFRPSIHKEDKFFNKYDPDGLIQYKEEYIIDEKNDNNVRLLNNQIRYLFDINIDGLFVDEKGISKEISDNSKTAYIGKFLHDSLYDISREYPSKNILYNKLYIDEKNNETYVVKYADVEEKMSSFHKALTYSLIDSVYYECTEREYKKLGEKYKQIIIK